MRPYVRAANVGWDGLKLDDVKMMNFTDGEMATYELKKGDLLLGEASGSASEVGKPALWSSEIDGCAFQNTLLRVRADGQEPRYLLHYFKHVAAAGEFAKRSRGVGIIHLGREALASWIVPLPPIEEQRRIAMILDKADELRAKRRAALAHLDSLTQSIFLDMFGYRSSQRNRSNLLALGEVTEDIIIGPFGSLLHQSDYASEGNDGVPLVNPMHLIDNVICPSVRHRVSMNKYGELERWQLRLGDIVLARRGEMGRCATVENDHVGLVCGSGSLIVRPDRSKVTSTYLQRVLSSPATVRRLEQSAQGVTMMNLNSTIVASLPIEWIPLREQVEFDRRLEAARVVRGHKQMGLSDLETLFASLQQRAFAGEL
jgi:type I restriction enzyme, S subunit